MFQDLNVWAILAAALVYFLLGGVWYAAVFARPWTAALAFSGEVEAQARADFPKALGVHFASGILTAFVLANLARALEPGTFAQGVVCGFWVWLGIALTLNLNSLMFEKRPKAVFLVNAGFFLVAFTIMGGILTVWR